TARRHRGAERAGKNRAVQLAGVTPVQQAGRNARPGGRRADIDALAVDRYSLFGFQWSFEGPCDSRPVRIRFYVGVGARSTPHLRDAVIFCVDLGRAGQPAAANAESNNGHGPSETPDTDGPR